MLHKTSWMWVYLAFYAFQKSSLKFWNCEDVALELIPMLYITGFPLFQVEVAYPKIGDSKFKGALWTCKQWLALKCLKMWVRYWISIVLLLTCSYKAFSGYGNPVHGTAAAADVNTTWHSTEPCVRLDTPIDSHPRPIRPCASNVIRYIDLCHSSLKKGLIIRHDVHIREQHGVFPYGKK